MSTRLGTRLTRRTRCLTENPCNFFKTNVFLNRIADSKSWQSVSGPFGRKVNLFVEGRPVPVEGTLLGYNKTNFALVQRVPPSAKSVGGHFFTERYRRPSTFSGANERSHRKLFESAIRIALYLFLQKIRGYSDWSVWTVSVPV